MCPRIDGEYSGSSSVGSQPNSHVVSPLQPRRPLRFSTLLALDVRRPRGEVHRIPAALPRADRYRRSPLSLFCSGLPSPPRPASAMGFRASRASPAGHCRGIEVTRSLWLCRHRSMPEPNTGDRNSHGSGVEEFRTAKLRRGSPDVCPGPGCGEDDRRLLRFSNGF